MVDLTADLEETQSGRYTCPFCDARRGLSVDQEEGESGVYHCFSCLEGGTGAELYAYLHDVTIGEALDAFGIDADDLSREVKQKEQIAPKPETPDYTDAEQRERRRVYQCMSAEEIRLRAAYRASRAAAQERRNRAEFDKWQGKLDALIDHVMRRERIGQREIQKADANTQHLD